MKRQQRRKAKSKEGKSSTEEETIRNLPKQKNSQSDDESRKDEENDTKLPSITTQTENTDTSTPPRDESSDVEMHDADKVTTDHYSDNKDLAEDIIRVDDSTHLDFGTDDNVESNDTNNDCNMYSIANNKFLKTSNVLPSIVENEP